jgi:triosephosphate isomerase (TIM)
MSTRRPLVGGNWKMHTLRSDALALAQGIATRAGEVPDVDVACFVPFVWIGQVATALQNSPIACGTQDVSEHPQGAFTGEISADMLLDAGAVSVLTGHSERRHVIGESNELVGLKTSTALRNGLRCLLCVGETLDQREAGSTDAINEQQLQAALSGISEQALASLDIAYEPVWAIGTGKTASPDDAQRAHETLRALLASMYSQDLADSIRIVYGGSVKPDNAAELFGMPDIDGGLIGGASLEVSSFLTICLAAQNHCATSMTQESVGES